MSPRHPGRLAERRHGRLHRLPRAVPARAGLVRRDQLPDARREGRGVRRAGPTGHRARGRARHHRADAVDAGRVLGRRRRVAPAARPTSRRIPGVWRHGDWLTITERGSCIVTGRSDATLKRGGVRIGTAEFYGHRGGAAGGRRQPRRPPRGRRRRAGRAAAVRGAARRASRSTTALRGAIATALRERALAAPRARRDRRGAGDPADALGQEARGAGQADPARRRRRTSPRRRTRSRTRAPSRRSRRSPASGGASARERRLRRRLRCGRPGALACSPAVPALLESPPSPAPSRSRASPASSAGSGSTSPAGPPATPAATTRRSARPPSGSRRGPRPGDAGPCSGSTSSGTARPGSGGSADVDACAAAWATDPATFELSRSRRTCVAGQGPWPPEFDAAVRAGHHRRRRDGRLTRRAASWPFFRPRPDGRRNAQDRTGPSRTAHQPP